MRTLVKAFKEADKVMVERVRIKAEIDSIEGKYDENTQNTDVIFKKRDDNIVAFDQVVEGLNEKPPSKGFIPQTEISVEDIRKSKQELDELFVEMDGLIKNKGQSGSAKKISASQPKSYSWLMIAIGAVFVAVVLYILKNPSKELLEDREFVLDVMNTVSGSK